MNDQLEFRPVRIEDKAAIEAYTRPSGICNCDLAFANMFCWEPTYRAAWCVREGFLLIRFYIDGSRHIGYMQPLGEGDFTPLLPLLEADARRVGQPLRLSGLTREGEAMIRRARPDFGIYANRDYEDYVYRADDLRTLPGRRYQPKRNHINRFTATYPAWRYEPLTAERFGECMRLERQWRAARPGHAAELRSEQQAMQRALDHFDALGLCGGCLYVGDELAAFTFGSAINDEAFCIHVEKADTRFDGAFTMINKLFAERLPARYTLIDREEDLGLDGLRRSKLSYHPLFLQPKLTAQCLNEEQRQIRTLWREAFGDEEGLIDQFLLTRYAPQQLFARREAGRIVAMLHLIPFGRTAYIYAVATAEAFRRRGYAGALLGEALDFARSRGFARAALIPASEELKRYYAKFGFEERDLPVRFRTRDDFDFGSGDPDADRAMLLPLDGEPFDAPVLELCDPELEAAAE